MEYATGLLGRAARICFLAAAVVLPAGCSLLPEPPAPPPSPKYGEHHCYRTLAQVDCHAVALAEEATRREGWYEAPLAEE